jgi:hypothetical protein
MRKRPSTQLAVASEVTHARARIRLTKWQQRFLSALRKTPSVKHACSAAGISRQHAYKIRAAVPAFAEQWQDALDASVDDLEAVAFKLAAEGDANLITFLLRCHRPQIYKERSELGVVGGVVIVPMKTVGAE